MVERHLVLESKMTGGHAPKKLRGGFNGVFVTNQLSPKFFLGRAPMKSADQWLDIPWLSLQCGLGECFCTAPNSEMAFP